MESMKMSESARIREIEAAKRSHTSQIISLLRHRIVTFQAGYRAGDRLTLQQIAKELGVSTMPVLMAINILASQGLVDVRPRSGTFVAKPSPDRAQDLCALIGQLEAANFRLVHGRCPEPFANKLRELVDTAERYAQQDEVEAYLEVDSLFHRTVGSLAQNSELTKVYEMANDRIYLLSAYKARVRADRLVTLQQHRALIGIFAQEDEEKSVQAVVEHWNSVYTRYMQVEKGGAPAK
jgi:DNA-binding GntR family transcriptional regulator